MKQYRIATAAYPIDWFNHWFEYQTKLTNWCETAADAGAVLLVFPEYGSMELAALLGDQAGNLAAQIDGVSQMLPEVDDLHQRLSDRLGVHILSSSAPFRLCSGKAVNRARFFTPHQAVRFQDKRIMTRFEREDWCIHGGDTLKVFDTALGKIGIAICYDSEFPLIARQMCEQGMQVLLVPSCTDSLRGFYRVKIGAMARALENQCYAIQAPTVGVADWSPSVDVNIGAAGVYAPPDTGFPETGVVMQGGMNAAGWVFADIDLGLVDAVRQDGAVLPVQHWPEQIMPI